MQGNLVDESGIFDMQKKHCRYLEQYRTDSIFRIMGLKAHVKVNVSFESTTDSSVVSIHVFHPTFSMSQM